MSQLLLFTHKNYDPFHLYIKLIKPLFQNHVIFLNEDFPLYVHWQFATY